VLSLPPLTSADLSGILFETVYQFQ